MDSGDVYSTSFFLYDSANSGALDSRVMFLLVTMHGLCLVFGSELIFYLLMIARKCCNLIWSVLYKSQWRLKPSFFGELSLS